MILSPLCDEPKGLKTKLCMVSKGYGRREEGGGNDSTLVVVFGCLGSVLCIREW
jgi:hypothetical protein